MDRSVCFRGGGVGRGGSLMGCGHLGGWVCLCESGVRCGGVVGRVNAMCDWGWVPRFALEYVELLGVRLLGMGFMCLASVGSTSEWRLDAGFIAGGVMWFVCGGSLCGVIALFLRDFLVDFVLCAGWAGLGYG